MLTVTLICVTIAAPILFAYMYGSSATPPNPSDQTLYSTNLSAIFIPDCNINLKHFFCEARESFSGMGSYEVFLGHPMLLMTLFGIYKSKRRPDIQVAFICGIVFLLLSAGPELHIFSRRYDVKMPYEFISNQ